MSGAWIAGSIRGRLMLEHRLGVDSVREVSRQPSLAAAADMLVGTAYADAAAAASLQEVERRIAAALALRLRVLAAWLPREGAGLLRVLGGWFELANIEDRLGYLAGGPLWPAIPLGVLASAWDGAAQVQDPAQLRALLAASAWGEPGGERPEDIALALRFAWARRVAVEAPEARGWAAGAAAILLASELFLTEAHPSPSLVPSILGAEWPGATSVADLCRRLPAAAAWPLRQIDEPEELWQAPVRWWRQVELDSQTLLASGWRGRGVVVGVVGLLALDAVRVGSALALASSGGRAPSAAEVLDALC